ncbi:MAG TPA: dTMP kinase [Candidatus Competibacteraceae bacterium]|nr:dTMP kinase [Candidatus Competibacteraceae bacterium]
MIGKFVTVEGIEGAGKTTQLAFIRDYLETAGKRVLLTREPGGTALGEEIRALLLQQRQEGMSADAELLLLFAARAEHLHQIIRPALESGIWVLCDRFTEASYAYQGGGRGVAWERIAVLENWVQGDLRPDLTLLFDLPAEQGLARAGRRGLLDRFEREELEFFQRVRKAYLEQAACHPNRYRIVDASLSVATVRTEVEAIVQALLAETP